ncbi:MAG: autotransporter outer membrane beta-barrel domain-containing protein [Alphaproteobacteria bacterium]
MATNNDNPLGPVSGGFSGTLAVPNNVNRHSDAFTAGERITISVNTVTNDGVLTITIRDTADAITYASLVLSDGASASGTVPAGAVGMRFVVSGVSAGEITSLTVSCTAAADAAASDGDDVGSDPAQAAQLVTVQTSVIGVTNFSGFVNSAVARRFTAGPADASGQVAEAMVPLRPLGGASGSSGLAGGDSGSGGERVQIASLLPVGQLMGAATGALSGGGFEQLAVAGAQLADTALAAADRPFGLWINGAASFVDSSKDGGQFSGDVLSLGVGGDYAVNERLLVGLAVGYERGDIDTGFNAGDLTSNGFTAAPYVGWQPFDELVLDATAGVTFLDYEISRSSGTIQGDYAATRAFAAINATGNFRFDRLRLSPLGGLLYFRETQQGYTDSAGTTVDEQTIDLGRLTAGVEAGYTFDIGEALAIEPYARLEGEFDFIEAGSVTLTTGETFRPGRYGGSVAGGLNMFSGSGFSGNLEASYDSLGRDSYDSVTIQGTLRFAF